MKTKSHTPSSSLFLLLLTLFFFFWLHSYMQCIDTKDWCIENILVVLFLAGLCSNTFIGKYTFSNLSYVCIFVYLALHISAAQYAYSSHPFGFYLQQRYHLLRNPFDRIVHFSFGFLMAYPMRDVLINRFDYSFTKSFFRPIEIVLSLSALFELVEWCVACYIFPDHDGQTYVGTQGDIWDAQKDITFATVGAVLAMALAYFVVEIKYARKRKIILE